MKSTTIIGALLIVVGIVSLALGGISYTSREKVIDVGPIEASTEKRETIPLPPVLGALALAGGVILVFAGARRKA